MSLEKETPVGAGVSVKSEFENRIHLLRMREQLLYFRFFTAFGKKFAK